MIQIYSRFFLLSAYLTLVAHATLPLIDFDRMGKVGLAGAFAGFDFFSNSSIAFDPATATLFSRSLDGSLTRLASTNSGGRINAACDLDGLAYFAGSFSSIADVSTSNIVSYNPSTNSFTSLSSGAPNGEIHSLFCDQRDRKVWGGGSFTSPGAALAVWDPRAQSWGPPPFKGVSGAQSRVYSITTNSSSSSIFFAGSFLTAFGSGSISINGTNNPNVPFSAGATPFSSSLVPIPLQSAELHGSPSTADPNFNNIQNILCPSGPDGPGNSWFAIDNGVPLITIRAFSFISASGIRLGNTFQAGHGTTGFSLTTIPDNQVRTLTFVDPATGQNRSCSNPCPLSTDPSLLYQDFLFDSTLSITGVQIELSGFTGRSPGLHLLQLLSSGAFASSVESNNGQSCFAPNPSNTTRTGDWVAKLANTGIAGTTQTVLVSDVNVGTSPASGPSFTWIPYVSAAGNYDINLLIPGCNNFQDCGLRTSVKVTIFPGQGLPPFVKTVSQRNTDDATVLLYSGPIVPSTPNFVATITMTLADQPEGSGQGGRYEIVADRVQLILKSVNFSSSNDSTSSTTLQGLQRGFGFFEWPRSAAATGNSLDGTQALPNSTFTALDGIGTQLFSSIGDSNQLNAANITAVAHHPSGAIFLGGSFRLSSGSASGASNIVMFRNGALVSIADGGLNGRVSALLVDQNRLYVGGAFRDTAAGGAGGRLRAIAMYDIDRNTWSPMGSGINGEVTGLSSTNGNIQVVGSFTSAGDVDVSGIAVWSTVSNTWTTSGGFVVGDMTLISNSTSQQWVAGNIASSRKFGASGIVLLQNSDENEPRVNPVQVALSGARVANNTTPNRRRSHAIRSTWANHVPLRHFFARQTPARPNVTLPPPPPTPAPAVLIGIFWTNTSSSAETTILGGNFTHVTDSGAVIAGVLFYDTRSGSSSGVIGPQVNGIVRSLLVDGNRLYVGGEFTIPGTNANGLAIYDLATQQWDLNNPQPLQPGSSTPVVVRSITKSSSQTNKVIVAGSFSQAGSLRCEAVCVYDTSSNQWNAPGIGIQGQVATVAYAGDDQEFLFVGGSLTVGGSTPASVAQFDLVNSTWLALGSGSDIPGPVTALEVNAGNVSSIFAAGRASDGSNSFLSFWNGANWSTLGSNLDADVTVSQLTMVPLQDTHPGQGVIQPDRMLLLSGALTDPSYGNASSVLYDGQNFIPYIASTSTNGQSGFVASLFHSFAKFSFAQRKLLATGVVILISIAIAAGVVFLLALIGILWTLFSRRDDKIKHDVTEDDDDSTQHRPSSLLEHINAATRTTILGTGQFGSNADREEEKLGKDGEQDPFGPDASNYLRAETPSDAVGGLLPEESSRIAHVRYDFVPDGEGELPLQAGAEVEVLDDKDHAWWYARDIRTGREGIVPAAYLY